MPRTWTALAVAAATAALVATGFTLADDEGHGPLHDIMENVNKDTIAIKKAVRTPAAFKKANDGKDVATKADDLTKLAKKARDIKDAVKKAKDVKNPEQKWTELMDGFIKSTDEVAAAARKGDYPATKDAVKKMNTSCADCHKDFRIDEDEFK